MPLDAIETTNNAYRATPLMAPGASSNLLFPVVERGLSWSTAQGQSMPFTTHKALVRPETSRTGAVTPHVLSVVNTTYKLVQNKELFTALEDQLIARVDPAKLEGVKIRDQVAHFGRSCYREYVFPGIVCDIGSRLPIGFRIVVANSYGGTAIKILAGAIDFWCSNGMVSGQFESAYARHSSGLKLDRFDTIIGTALDRFVSDAAKWKRWIETPVTHMKTMELFRQLATNPTTKEKLTNQWLKEIDDRGLNLWSIYSAFTHYASHNEGDFAVRRASEERAGASTMFNRELEVAKWVNSPAFAQLEGVAC